MRGEEEYESDDGRVTERRREGDERRKRQRGVKDQAAALHLMTD